MVLSGTGMFGLVVKHRWRDCALSDLAGVGNSPHFEHQVFAVTQLLAAYDFLCTHRRVIREASLSIGIKPEKNKRPESLLSQLKILNETLGNDGPVQVSDFKKLVDVRDSIIHADARAEWKDNRGKDRKVADEYCNGRGDVELSENQVKEAVEKAIRQVVWYDSHIQPSP